MTDAVLIFTFSPVQPFIVEARRTADLFAGSRILVELAKAAAEAIRARDGSLVYPAPLAIGSPLSNDVPNKLVAVVPATAAEEIALTAKEALLGTWHEIAEMARKALTAGGYPAPDTFWDDIWQRQLGAVWEVYWATAPLGEGPPAEAYRTAYKRADRALNAAKRTRAFAAVEEPGLKDSLSGRRSALRTASLDAKGYWGQVAKETTAAKLRPDGRERLDTLGAVKRFATLDHPASHEGRFLSTSSVASDDFLARALDDGAGRTKLRDYRDAIETLVDDRRRYTVPRRQRDWPYDGDLFYLETLTPERLKDSYGKDKPDATALKKAENALKALHGAAGGPPSPYYAVVALDGDNMGARITDALKEGDSLAGHQAFSTRLTTFAGAVRPVVENQHGSLVYNGGDDVLFLAPLSTALPIARDLARHFRESAGGTASAGIAITHHLSPLDAALSAARQAEGRAKDVPDKNAVCVRVLKRSGETVEMSAPWDADGGAFDSVVRLLTPRSRTETAPLAARFPYDVEHATRTLPAADPMFASELRRLLGRHYRPAGSRDAPGGAGGPSAANLAERLVAWAEELRAEQSARQLARWLLFARFVARGGEE